MDPCNHIESTEARNKFLGKVFNDINTPFSCHLLLHKLWYTILS